MMANQRDDFQLSPEQLQKYEQDGKALSESTHQLSNYHQTFYFE
jgi:hypothetical protein